MRVATVTTTIDKYLSIVFVSCANECMTVLQSTEDVSTLWINSTTLYNGTLWLSVAENSSYFLSVFTLGNGGLLNSSLIYFTKIDYGIERNVHMNRLI